MSADESFPLPLEGGCHCGQIRCRVTAAPRFIFACHCADCQQLTATALSLGTAVPDAGFELHGGHDPHCWAKREAAARKAAGLPAPPAPAGRTPARTTPRASRSCGR